MIALRLNADFATRADITPAREPYRFETATSDIRLVLTIGKEVRAFTMDQVSNAPCSDVRSSPHGRVLCACTDRYTTARVRPLHQDVSCGGRRCADVEARRQDQECACGANGVPPDGGARAVSGRVRHCPTDVSIIHRRIWRRSLPLRVRTFRARARRRSCACCSPMRGRRAMRPKPRSTPSSSPSSRVRHRRTTVPSALTSATAQATARRSSAPRPRARS